MNPKDPLAPQRYRAVAGFGQDEILIEKSRFIALAYPIEDADAVKVILTDLRKQHPEATHIVPAYIIGPGGLLMRANDDGEPSGTAGVPMLEVLKKEDVTDTLVVAIRYFGGIKLGAGGLIRAYTKTATTALQAAGITDWCLHQAITMTVPYPLQGAMSRHIQDAAFDVRDTTYDSAVHYHLMVPLDALESTMARLIDWSSGQATFQEGAISYQPEQQKTI